MSTLFDWSYDNDVCTLLEQAYDDADERGEAPE
jgi:hypothetical protein